MKTRIVTAVFFTIAILAFIIPAYALPWLPLVLFVLVALGASLELHQALLHKVSGLTYKSMMLGSLIMLSPLYIWYSYRELRPDWHFIKVSDLPLDAAWKTDMVWLLALGIAVTAAIAVFYIFAVILFNCLRRGPETLVKSIAESMSVLYIALPFSVVPLLMFAIPNGYRWLLLAIFLPWVSDVFAYFAGVTWGKTKILPRISPQKTFEGFLGGLVGSMLISSFYFIIAMNGQEPMKADRWQNFLYGLIIGLVLSLVSQMGDWLASALKRWVRIKDFSHLLPGHGGILDRFDSVILTLPLALLCALFYYLV